MTEEIGIIDEVNIGRERDCLKLFGHYLLPKTKGWIAIRKFYKISLLNLFKLKPLGYYYVDNPEFYEYGDKVKVQIDDNKIISVEKICHLNLKEQFIHNPIIIMFTTIFTLILIITVLDIHI